MGVESALITNKVYTATVEGIDLCSAKLLQMTAYRPPRTFRAGVLHLNKGTYLLFDTGNVLILGEPDLDQFEAVTHIELSNLEFSETHFVAQASEAINLRSKTLLKINNYKPPSNFTGGVLKLPGGTYLLFESGKVVINGVKTEPDLLEFTLETDLHLENVQMSHCSGHIKFGNLNLQGLSSVIENSVYEPELHPGLMFHLDNVSVVVQHTGAVFFCGCRSVDEAVEIKLRITKVINRYSS